MSCQDIDSNGENRFFNCASKGQGAFVLASFYALEDKGNLAGSTANGILSNIISYGFTTSQVKCKESFVDVQETEINCNNAAGSIIGQNKNCLDCVKHIEAWQESRQSLEKDAKKSNPDYVVQIASDSLIAKVDGLTVDKKNGICKFVCDQCVGMDVDQNIQMKIVADCKVNTEEFIDAFVKGMSLQAETEVTKHQEALKTTGLQIRHKDDIKKLSVEISNTIIQMTKVEALTRLQLHAFYVQETLVEPNSTSVVIQNVTQTISQSMFASVVSKQYNNVSVKNSIDYKEKATQIQIETSFTDLLKSLQAAVNSLDNLLLSTIGKIMVSLIAIVAVALIVFAAIFFTHPSFIFGGVNLSQ